MGIPLIINDRVRAKIAKLVDNAQTNKIPLKRMRQLAKGGGPAVGDNDNFVMHIPMGYRVVYSIEQQLRGWFKHLSISCVKQGRYPSPEAVNMVLAEFGFYCRLPDENLIVFMEDKYQAINIMEGLLLHG